MATKKDYAEFVLESAGERASLRAMFGEYALYYDGKVVALICNNIVYLKINEESTNILGEKHTTGRAYKGSSLFYKLTENEIENINLFPKLLHKTSLLVKVIVKKKKGE